MGGSGGVIVVQQAVVKALSDPTVHGQLPHTTRLAIDTILTKDSTTWDAHDCKRLSDAILWALCNLK